MLLSRIFPFIELPFRSLTHPELPTSEPIFCQKTDELICMFFVRWKVTRNWPDRWSVSLPLYLRSSAPQRPCEEEKWWCFGGGTQIYCDSNHKKESWLHLTKGLNRQAFSGWQITITPANQERFWRDSKVGLQRAILKFASESPLQTAFRAFTHKKMH